MTGPTVTLSVEVKTADGFRELTTWKVDELVGGVDNAKRKLSDLADELAGKGVSRRRDRVTGIERIAAERQRQIEVEGWTAEHDAEYEHNELWEAARSYLAAARWAQFTNLAQPMSAHDRDQQAFWPWHEDWWKPSLDPIRNLEKAGALIAAEIDRLQSEGEG